MAVELNATITERREINHGLLVIQVTPDFEVPPFKPGQYGVLGLPAVASRISYADPETEDSAPPSDKLIKRAYSVTSSSLQGKYLEFYVAQVRSGALTPRLFALRTSDRIWLGKKIVGMFTLDDAPAGNDIILVATGTGLAPYISMLRSAYCFDANRRTIVIHGARAPWDLGYRGELEGMASQWPHFHYLPIIDEIEREPRWPGKVGFVDAYFKDGTLRDLLRHDLDPDRTSVFLCGNPLMIASMEKILGARGFTLHSHKQPGNIFVEKYWAD